MKILILEQDDCLSATYKEFFEECGHYCYIANGRKSAVLLIHSQKFDTMLADLPMSDFDFSDLLNTMRNNDVNKKIKIFVVRPDEFSLKTHNILKEIGIAGFFTKSITKNLVQQVLSEKKTVISSQKLTTGNETVKLKKYLTKSKA